jgi:hypothetical protein
MIYTLSIFVHLGPLCIGTGIIDLAPNEHRIASARMAAKGKPLYGIAKMGPSLISGTAICR